MGFFLPIAYARAASGCPVLSLHHTLTPQLSVLERVLSESAGADWTPRLCLVPAQGPGGHSPRQPAPGPLLFFRTKGSSAEAGLAYKPSTWGRMGRGSPVTSHVTGPAAIAFSRPPPFRHHLPLEEPMSPPRRVGWAGGLPQRWRRRGEDVPQLSWAEWGPWPLLSSPPSGTPGIGVSRLLCVFLPGAGEGHRLGSHEDEQSNTDDCWSHSNAQVLVRPGSCERGNGGRLF